MKKLLLLLAAAGLVGSVASAEQTLPENGKYYQVKHSSGKYLTRDGGGFVIADAAEGSDQQVFQFFEVGEGVYNIALDNGLYLGSDRGWSSCALSNNAATYTQFEVTIGDGSEYALLQNLGQRNKRGDAKSFLGCDADDAHVYTDKASDKDLYHWTIEAAPAGYSFPVGEQLPDVYPDHNLPDTDPRKNAYNGYKLVFAEEFNATDGQPSTDIWNYEKGWKRNNEDQYYYNYPNNIWFENGVCVFNGRHEDPETIKNPSYDPRYGTGNQLIKWLEWTSASIITKGSWNGDYSWQYGIYEVRAKLPAYTGCWPAIWSTGRQYSWPKGGEIDLMEWYGGVIHGNVCWGDTKWNSATVSYSELNKEDPNTEWGDEYHIWRMFWDYDHIEMWCDNVLVNNIDLNTTVNPVREGQDWSGVNPFRDVRQVLWLNLALGGNSGGSLANVPQNNYYMVDYARIYQKIGTDGLAKYHVDDYAPDATIRVPDKDAELSGIQSPVADLAECAAPVYYNLQGMPVADPVPGQVVICQQDGRATKMIVR